ncbi:unnamed protein product [Kuraishia capsulata CBS 1993]|uniref:Glutathione hydrolase n=1 Tax=Kuraishia capsulata CBS 1993 TaxID=1382522 RepID=W6MJ73_9ASCO|nr:uncharacterized protein KUCA_T00002267001 [Kuraishia capsulata CBS 1993]CDK26296.1 unnamed protein product [Kuraishia capsulata CBS 1993]
MTLSSESSPLLLRSFPRLRAKRSNAKKWIPAALLTLGILSLVCYGHGRSFKKHPPEYRIPDLGSPTWSPSLEQLVIAENGTVASDVKVCSQMGVDILKRGGFAADAAVTVALCIGTINSMSSGIGGGCFITSKKFGTPGAISIDAREMAPAKAHRDMFKGREDDAKVGGLAVATPGELKGLFELYSRHGSGNLEWADLVMPVADLAREGWIADPILEFSLWNERDYILKHPRNWAWAFNEKGRLVTQGDHVKREAYSKTLEAIARNGSSDIFYDSEGPLVEGMVTTVRQSGGILEADDFAKYQARVEPALEIETFNRDQYRVFTSNGASSGLSLMAGLQIMNHYEDQSQSDYGVNETQRLVETMKWMGTVRSNLGDVSPYCENETEIAEHHNRYAKFSSAEWARQTQQKIDDNHTLKSWRDYHPAYQMNDPHGTSHFSVVDKFGNAVGMTTTVNLLFGSKVCDPTTGIILNDEMDDFSLPTAPNAFGLEPSIFNFIEPYKRPLSSCSPTVVVDRLTGKPDLVIGAAGGSHITPAVLQAIIRTYHYNLTMLETIAFPRIHHQLLPNEVALEIPAEESVKEELELRGHEVIFETHRTAMNGIRNAGDGVWHAVSDFWRKKGVPVGY